MRLINGDLLKTFDMVRGGIETAEKIREYEKERGLHPVPIFGYTSDEPGEGRSDLIERGIFTHIFSKDEAIPLQMAVEEAFSSKV